MAIKKIYIAHLYPSEMNIYGDTGNVEVLSWRLKHYGYSPEVLKINIGDKLTSDIDIIVAGGGQDSGQGKVVSDLKKKKKSLISARNNGVVMLAICGSYQLFGHYFKTQSSQTLEGVGIFDAFTEAKNKRLIGNIIVKTKYGELVGFENHSGQTFLLGEQKPLGRVVQGYGNNQKGNFEGAETINAFGSYMHGPILPKNPRFADELINRAILRKFGHEIDPSLSTINDSFAGKAAKIAKKRRY